MLDLIAKVLDAQNVAIVVPVLVALVGSLLAPLWLARRKDRMAGAGSLLEEGREYRRDLMERVDSLETRLENAGKAMNDALDEIRRLKSECERHESKVRELERELRFLRETS